MFWNIFYSENIERSNVSGGRGLQKLKNIYLKRKYFLWNFICQISYFVTYYIYRVYLIHSNIMEFIFVLVLWLIVVLNDERYSLLTRLIDALPTSAIFPWRPTTDSTFTAAAKGGLLASAILKKSTAPRHKTSPFTSRVKLHEDPGP